MANNSVNFVDPSGLKFTVTGSKEARDAFIKMAGDAAGVELSISWSGTVRINSYRPNVGPSSARSLLTNMVKGNTDVQMHLVYGDPGVHFGGAAGLEFNVHTIDLKDMENLNENSDCTHQHGTGALQHELAEAYWMSRGLDFRTIKKYDGAGAHGAGGRAEKNFYLDKGFNKAGPVYPSPIQVQSSKPGAGDGGWLFNYGNGHRIQAPWSWFGF